MFRRLLAGLALGLLFAAPAVAADKRPYLVLDQGGSFWITAATISPGSPASIVRVKCLASVCAQQFSAWFEKDRFFPHGSMISPTARLALQDVRFFEYHRSGSMVEVVLHIGQITQLGEQNGIDAVPN